MKSIGQKLFSVNNVTKQLKTGLNGYQQRKSHFCLFYLKLLLLLLDSFYFFINLLMLFIIVITSL